MLNVTKLTLDKNYCNRLVFEPAPASPVGYTLDFQSGDPGSKQDVALISFLRIYRRNATIYTTNKAANEVCIDCLYKCAPESDAQSTATSKYHRLA